MAAMRASRSTPSGVWAWLKQAMVGTSPWLNAPNVALRLLMAASSPAFGHRGGRGAGLSSGSCRGPRSLDLHRGRVPDLRGVLPDRPVARELAHVGDVHDGPPRPLRLVTIGPGDPVLGGHVGGVVGEQKVTVAAGQEGADDGAEEIGLARAERPAADHVEDPGQLGRAPVDVGRGVVGPPRLDLGRVTGIRERLERMPVDRRGRGCGTRRTRPSARASSRNALPPGLPAPPLEGRPLLAEGGAYPLPPLPLPLDERLRDPAQIAGPPGRAAEMPLEDHRVLVIPENVLD